MQNLSNIAVIRELLSRHGFSFSKQLGQNFLINPSVCPRMAEFSYAGPQVGMIEIGPGIGILTRELSARAKKVVAVELDERLLPVLEETLAGCSNVKVLHADAMKVDFAALIREEFGGEKTPARVALAANLPYYITSPLIMRLLESRLPLEALTVMVQKEAAQRLCAEPGTRAAGAVSLAVRYYSEPEILFGVSRGSFLPAPSVDSAVIRLRIRSQPPVFVQNEAALFSLIRAAFSQRRKTLGNALCSGLKLEKASVLQKMAACGIPENARAESLTLQQFGALSDALEGKQNGASKK